MKNKTDWLAIASAQQKNQNSWLCVGLDPDFERMPAEFARNESGIYYFCRSVIESVAPFCSAFKPQFAHFAGQRALGALEQICHDIRKIFPSHQLILDVKRGDIDSTARFYAREAFEVYRAHSCTLHPYMGWDSISPYLEMGDQYGVFILCRTSNPSGSMWQSLPCRPTENEDLSVPLFELIAKWVNSQSKIYRQLGLVAGATHPDELSKIKGIASDLPLLIPGIGAQGGDLEQTLQTCLRLNTSQEFIAPTWINSSRAILYPVIAQNESWQNACVREARKVNDQINQIRFAYQKIT